MGQGVGQLSYLSCQTLTHPCRAVPPSRRVRVLRPDIADPHTSIRTQAQALKALRTTNVGFLQFFNTHR